MTDQWTIGNVALLPAEDARRAIESHRPDGLEEEVIEYWDRHTDELLGHCVAEIAAETYDAALSSLSQAIDALRVFQQHRTLVETTLFGLPGDIRFSLVPYLQAGALPGWGSGPHDHRAGFTFTERSLHEWNDSSAFQFVSSALRDPSSEAGRRSLIGIELLSRAIVADPALKMLFVVMALEAMLIDRKVDLKRYAFAQHIAFLSCGRRGQDLCGRDRDTCPYLATPPTRANRVELDRLAARAQSDLWWSCSEWTKALDWYSSRNDIAHGGSLEVSEEAASRALFWTLRHLIVPIFELFAEHPEHPIRALRSAIAELPDPPDWEAVAESDAFDAQP